MTEEIMIGKKDVVACNYWEACDYYKQLKRLEQENKELKEEIQFHNRENSNLLAERNALQIGYDEIREVREQLRSALEEIRMYINKCMNSLCDNNCEYWNNCKGNYNINNILTKINEVLG